MWVTITTCVELANGGSDTYQFGADVEEHENRYRGGYEVGEPTISAAFSLLNPGDHGRALYVAELADPSELAEGWSDHVSGLLAQAYEDTQESRVNCRADYLFDLSKEER